ncbi:hypothetical protein SNE40_013948 [Patella caerulea]|uniref:DCC-interacting protein 13-alpha n=1 Tax=Patella caerulea TaxID=87958 RepID=A0AAN8JH89_PATCE
MPDIEKLHLEDALEDSPQTRNLLSVFEKDAFVLKKYTGGLQACCQRIMSAQNELCAATQGLAQQLRAYEAHKFPLESENSILTSTLKQFASYIDDISSIQQVLASQYSETMMYPINKFVQADIEEVSTMYEMYQISSHEHEQALGKYMKLSAKKKENEKARIETNEELYTMRKKFHQTSLHYYSCLNSLQYKRKCFLLEPVMGYLHAQRAFFQMGTDAVMKPEIEDFLGNINASVLSVHQELSVETQKTVELIDSIEKQSVHLYHPEPPIDMPYIPPNTSLAQKSGYLYQRSKQAILGSKWDRCYFFTQGGNLMSQSKDEARKYNKDFAGSLVVDLNEEGLIAEISEYDDRRFVFQIVAPSSKKTVVLQAENHREREEWIAAINNIVRDSGYVRGGKTPPKRKDRTPSLEKSQSADSQSIPSPTTLSGNGSRSSSVSTSATTTGAAATQGENTLVLDTPIQFDLVSPSQENRGPQSPMSGPPKRINPFDQSSGEVFDVKFDNAAFSQVFTVRFLGSMEVKADRGEPLVHDTIRQIMAARAIHNVFKMTESKFIVSNEGMRLLDPSNNAVRVEFALQDISFWSKHPENERYFGFITRTRIVGGAKNNLSFACHVFESNNSSEEICKSIGTATRMAFEALMAKRNAKAGIVKPKVNEEKKLPLENIEQLELSDSDSESLPLSPDGKFLLLANTDPSETGSSVFEYSNQPIRENLGDGDERRIEGAECESEA